MKFEMRCIGGVESAELEITKGEVTRVAGPNGSGKTSQLRALATVALDGGGNPLGLRSEKYYLRDGAKEGYAMLYGGDGGGRRRWEIDGKGGRIVADGKHVLRTNRVAVGLDDLSEGTAGAKSKKWLALVGAGAGDKRSFFSYCLPVLGKPDAAITNDADFAKALQDNPDVAEFILKILEIAQTSGWDHCHAVSRDRVKSIKEERADLYLGLDFNGAGYQCPKCGGALFMDGERKLCGEEPADLEVGSAENAVALALGEAAVVVTAPEGYRKHLVWEMLDAIHARADRVSELCGWPQVRISNGYSVTYGGRELKGWTHSASERWRAGVILQIAVAAVSRSEILVIDNLDLLDTKQRGVFMTALTETIVPKLDIFCVVAEADADA